MNLIYVKKKKLKIFGTINLLYLIKDFIKYLKIKLPINIILLFIIVLFIIQQLKVSLITLMEWKKLLGNAMLEFIMKKKYIAIRISKRIC